MNRELSLYHMLKTVIDGCFSYQQLPLGGNGNAIKATAQGPTLKLFSIKTVMSILVTSFIDEAE